MKIYFSKRRNLQEEWTQWFAWYPVVCEMADGNGAVVWLEQVERKETYGYGGPQWRHREYYAEVTR